MGIIRKASEIEAKKTISMLVYGQPGVGKSTLGMSAPEPVLIDCDGGVGRINVAHQGLTVQVSSWDDIAAALAEIETRPDIRSIVIDTVGKMLDYMSEHIMRTNTRMRKPDGSMTLQGYGLRKNMFIDFIRRVSVSGRNVIFIAHEREEKRGDETVKRPEVGGSSGNDLIKELDMVCYMDMVGKTRTLHFYPTEWYYAKNSAGMPADLNVTDLLDEAGEPKAENKLIRQIINAQVKSQKEAIERRAEFDARMSDLDVALAGTTDGAGLNAILDSLESAKPVLNSLVLGRAKVAKRGKELGLNADLISKRYPEKGAEMACGPGNPTSEGELL